VHDRPLARDEIAGCLRLGVEESSSIIDTRRQ
jgi:hypothetical protein